MAPGSGFFLPPVSLLQPVRIVLRRARRSFTSFVRNSLTTILDTPSAPSYRANKMSVASSTSYTSTSFTSSTSCAPGTPPLRSYYDTLFAAHGPQHWWPGRTPFEIIVGAILVQNTSWTNVEPAIQNLRGEELLIPRAIEAVSTQHLEKLIHSCGYFRQKTKKLKAFVRFLRDEYHGSLAKMFRAPTRQLREQLLAVHGIGPETADSILLYAAKHPVFVVDAYTRRILERHALAGPSLGYEDLRQLFERHLAPDVALYNEFHALIVHTGKHFCRPREPRCAACPLKSLLPDRSLQPSAECMERTVVAT
jgi:endonuclease-3 related protein